MRKFKGSRFYPIRPTAAEEKQNKDAIKDWNTEAEEAKLAYVCDCPFPNQAKPHANAERHRLSSCLYYVELDRLKAIAKKRKKEEDLKDAALKRGRK